MVTDGRSAKEWAVELARRGFLIFPLRSGSKEPFAESWVEIMTMDEETVGWWFDDRPGMNYGVCPGEDQVVIDLDLKENKNGMEVLKALQGEQDVTDWVIGETFMVNSPSGGCHLYLEVDHPVSNSHRFPAGAGIDVRGARGYVVGPGSELVEGLCKDTDTPGPYVVTNDADLLPAPEWITGRLRQHSDRDHKKRDPLFELDTPQAVKRTIEFLRHRDPAIEGLGGDYHTLMTATCIIDFGISESKCVEVMTEPFAKQGETESLSWNDRCVPPWDVYGRKGTLEEKVRNAWRYREREPGVKGGGIAFDEDDIREAMDISERNAEDDDDRFSRIRAHLFRGGKVFDRGKSQDFIIPEWLPAHGLTAILARRGGGKTVIMLDMALRIACDMDWHGQPIKPGMQAVYICGEDDEGAEEQIRAWCQMHGLERPPEDRFLFYDIITDIMSAEDTREWAECLKEDIGLGNRAVVFLDTWQRATSRGGQNKDEDMQTAVFHSEALARSLGGPVVIAFHPPKHLETVVMGSSIIENSTTAIWLLTDHTSGNKLEVIRIKGRGMGNYEIFRFESVGLGKTDEFDRERTGIVPVKLGGVGKTDKGDEGVYETRKAFAHVLLELEKQRKNEEPNSKHYATSVMAKKIVELVEAEKEGDDWAKGLLSTLREVGTVNLVSWRIVNDTIIEVFGSDPRGYDFGDGNALRLYQDGPSRRIKIDKSGIIP